MCCFPLTAGCPAPSSPIFAYAAMDSVAFVWFATEVRWFGCSRTLLLVALGKRMRERTSDLFSVVFPLLHRDHCSDPFRFRVDFLVINERIANSFWHAGKRVHRRCDYQMAVWRCVMCHQVEGVQQSCPSVSGKCLIRKNICELLRSGDVKKKDRKDANRFSQKTSPGQLSVLKTCLIVGQSLIDHLDCGFVVFKDVQK